MNDLVKIKRKLYSLDIDFATGLIARMTDIRDKSQTNIIDTLGGRFGGIVYTDYNGQSAIEKTREDGRIELSLIEKRADANLTLQDGLNYRFENATLDYQINWQFHDEYIEVSLSSESTSISQIGLDFDINFMDKNTDIDYMHQFLPSTPYTSIDGNVTYFGMNRPDGHWILFLSKSNIDGWRIRYGMENCHDLMGFQFLSRFDKNIKQHSHVKANEMTVYIAFPNSLAETFKMINELTGSPIPTIEISGGVVGTSIPVSVRGECDKIVVISPDEIQATIKLPEKNPDDTRVVELTLEKEGLYQILASNGESPVLDCKVLCFPGWHESFRKATNKIREPYHDGLNLCEGSKWAYALLLRKRLIGIDKRLQGLLDVFFRDKIFIDGKSIEELADSFHAVLPFPFERDGKQHTHYHEYGLSRLQDQVWGAMILLEAYKVYNEFRYLDYAARYIMNLVRDQLTPDGKLITSFYFNDFTPMDVSTVTACIIGFADTANLLQSVKDPRWRIISKAAADIAGNLLSRGMCFPTEGFLKAREMEDGSISCTALSLLYAYLYMEKTENHAEFLDAAGKILDFHDAWCMNTPDARMYRSTLRWWETNWEGDADGSSINAGHAWTLWKGEADFLYATATGDFDRAIRSYNAYMTNLAKIEPDGRMYTCYTPDFITSKPIKARIVHGFPTVDNPSMPHYLWPRAENTWFTASGLGYSGGNLIALSGSYEIVDGTVKFTSFAPELKIFFISDYNGVVSIKSTNTITICTKEPNINLIKGFCEWKERPQYIVVPDNGEIEFQIL